MVFIHKHRVMPSSGKVKTKSHLFSYVVLAGRECCPMCYLLQTGTINTLCTLGWSWSHKFCGIILFIHEPHVTPSSGKGKTKRHLFSFWLLEGRVCYTMCQLLQAGTTSSGYFAPNFRHYIS